MQYKNTAQSVILFNGYIGISIIRRSQNVSIIALVFLSEAVVAHYAESQ